MRLASRLVPLAVALLFGATTVHAQSLYEPHPDNAKLAKTPEAPLVSPSFKGGPATMSATVGDDIFLQGDFLSLGISGSGSFGTDNVTPAGFVRTGRLGYIFDEDGFGMGAPAATGDFFLPGNPEEGFSVGYRSTPGGGANVFANVERNNVVQITQTSVMDLSAGSTLAAEYIGVTNNGALQVTQNVSYDTGDKRVAVVITLQNLTTGSMFDVRYLRNVDPDQDQETTGSFTTRNTVLSNFPADIRAVVEAEGVNTGVPFYYVSTDPRARVSTSSGLSHRNPYENDIYDNPAPTGNTVVNDQAVTVGFDVGSLMAGESKSFQFFLGFDTSIATDPIVSISATPLTFPEGSGSTITATATEVSASDIVVSLGFSGTADGADFTSPATITIPAGSTSASIVLTAATDMDVEGDETVVIDIDNVSGGIENGVQQVTLTITDVIAPLGDCPESLVISDFQSAPNGGEFIEIQNVGMTTIDFSTVTCSAGATYNSVYFGVPLTGMLGAGETIQVMPGGALRDRFSGLVIADRADLPNGLSLGALQPDIISSLVYAGPRGVPATGQPPVFGFFNRDGANDAEYCANFAGELLTFGQNQCTPKKPGQALTLSAMLDAAKRSDASEVTVSPTPFSTSTTIGFTLAEADQVTLTIYDVRGREVSVLVDGPMEAGQHTATFDAKDLPSGVYLYRLTTREGTATGQLTLVR